MSARFTNKVTLVTGGGSGIGRAAALAFAGEGASVVVAGRRPGPLEQTVALIDAAGGQGSAVVTDVSRSEEVARLVRTTVDRHGGLHIAFNNAGIFEAGPVADMDESSWHRMVATNLTGLFSQHEARAHAHASTRWRHDRQHRIEHRCAPTTTLPGCLRGLQGGSQCPDPNRGT